MSKSILSPGWYTDLTNDEYHGSNGTSSTTLKKFLQVTPAQILYDKENPKPPSDAMNLGSAVHSMALEPFNFLRDFAIMKKVDGRTKAGRAYRESFEIENAGKTILDQETADIADRMASNIWGDPTAASLLTNALCEQSVFWNHETEDETVLLKCRPDALPAEYPFVADIKTTRDASWSFMQREIINRLYHLSAYMYLSGANTVAPEFRGQKNDMLLAFVLICVESQPPYQVACYELSNQFIDEGKKLFDLAIAKLLEANNCGYESYPKALRIIDFPSWSPSIKTL